MKTLNMTVTDKVLVRDATDDVIVCGNGDYQIQFAFDAEWNAFTKKTARFTWNGRHEDVEFNGNTCVIPMLMNTGVVTVGVYAGEDGVDDKPLATTKVTVYCVEGSRCGDSSPNPNTGENYTNQAKGYAAEAGRSAEAAAASAEEAKEAAEGAGGLKKVGSRTYSVTYKAERQYITDDYYTDTEILEFDGYSYLVNNGVSFEITDFDFDFTHIRLSVNCWAHTTYTNIIELQETSFNDGYSGSIFKGSDYVYSPSTAYNGKLIVFGDSTINIIKDMYATNETAGAGAVTVTLEFYA